MFSAFTHLTVLRDRPSFQRTRSAHGKLRAADVRANALGLGSSGFCYVPCPHTGVPATLETKMSTCERWQNLGERRRSRCGWLSLGRRTQSELLSENKVSPGSRLSPEPARR